MPIAKAVATYMGPGRDYTYEGRRFDLEMPMPVEGEALIKALESISGFRVVRRAAVLTPEPAVAPPLPPDTAEPFDSVATQSSAAVATAAAAGQSFVGGKGLMRKKG